MPATTSPRFDLTHVVEGQVLAEVVLNGNTNKLDALSHMNILDRDLTTPPGSPTEGDTYLVAATGAGGWSGQDGKLTYYVGGAWYFITPKQGMFVWVNDEAVFLRYSGTDWVALSITDEMSPADLSNPYGAWIADSETYANNDDVGTATDQSTGGSDLTSTGGNRPKFITNAWNGHSVYRFTRSASSRLQNLSNALAKPNTILMAVCPTLAGYIGATDETICDGHAVNTNRIFAPSSYYFQQYAGTSGSIGYYALGEFLLLESQFGDGSTVMSCLRVNGAICGAQVAAGTAAATGFTLGSTGAAGMDMDVAWAAVVNGRIPLAELQKVRNWHRRRYAGL